MVNLFKIITYLQNTISIHQIRDVKFFPKDEPDMDNSNKISFLNKNPFLIYFIYSMTGTEEDTQERFQEMVDVFTLPITASDLVYHKRIAFSIDSYGLDPK
ncbi:Uncharacterized protein family Ycf2 [Cynara cardunculus var. scolymus]|uniref:Uncharacterized protein family Ycf2 n=1 Tax=Cynara cardunculus var. scolymus TaxID=59895 RepID=A0A118JRG8_CYNCS|nr:Uncharacterized protein family Ycf2 [Cynara cardunculus var. scolymus]